MSWSISLNYDPTQWRAREACGPGKATTDLTVGTIIVWERRPYRIAESTPRPLTDWKPAYIEGWEKAGRPDPATWRYRPFILVLTPEYAPGLEFRQRLESPGNYYWTVLPEHFAVCRLCNELPPCSHEWGESVLRHARVEMEAALRIIPGCCLGCGEPITSRQKRILFEGPNLARPDFADDTAVFHARHSCRSEARAYDDRWAAAEPGRARKLFCEGHVRHHYDGTVECSQGVECPGAVAGELVDHRGAEWHRLVGGSRYTSGCWCVSGDVTARAENPLSARTDQDRLL